MLLFDGKIPVRVHPIFLLLAALIAWLNSMSMSGTSMVVSIAIWMVVIFISVLFHEYGHALTALAFGQKPRIDLAGMGGLTHRHGKKLSLGKEFLIVLNGPLFGLMLAFMAFLLSQAVSASHHILKFTLGITYAANIFWTILNLLPVHPLDGGRLLAIILESLFGLKGVKIALFLGMIFSVLVSIVFFLIQAIIAGALFMMLAFENYRSWKEMQGVTEKDQNEQLKNALREVDHSQQSPQEKIQKLQEIREDTKEGMLYSKATKKEALLCAEQGLFEEAYNLLSSLTSNHLALEELTLLQQLAFRCQKYVEAIKWGSEAFQEVPDYTIAIVNAFCYAQLKDSKPAIGWLETSIREGLPDPLTILHQKEFDPIRLDPQFQNLESKLTSIN